MIRLKNVCLDFGEKKVLRDCSIEIQKGETIAVLGSSGSGKSTVVKIMIGLLAASSGQVLIAGEDITRANEKKLDEVRLKMGMVFQYSALFDSMTVGDNVAFVLRQKKQHTEKQIQEIIEKMLEVVGLKGQKRKMPNELSGGMKKRVAFARAIAANPQIILYDEPTSGLDPVMSRVIDEVIVDVKKHTKATSVVVTHDLTSACTIADRIAVLNEGHFIDIGTPKEICVSANPFTRKFVDAWKVNL